MIKKHDFVEIEYTGRIKDNNIVFDTSDKKTAEQNNILNPEMQYGPVILCVGEQQVLPGLDKDIVGKEAGKEYTVTISPEQAFGKKDAKLIQLISTSKFHKENIRPMPGMQINVDGRMALVKSVTGGRTLVDFNHPLSGKEVSYSYNIKKIVTDTAEKIKALVSMNLGRNAKVDVTENTAIIRSKVDFPVQIQNTIKETFQKLVPELKDIQFKQE